jgi:hypothetical protein
LDNLGLSSISSFLKIFHLVGLVSLSVAPFSLFFTLFHSFAPFFFMIAEEIMAEVLGLITTIGDIAATGFKVAQTMAAIADDFGAAAKRVKAVAADTKAAVYILRQINIRLRGTQGLDSETADVLGKIVSQCKTDVDGIQKCLLPLISETGQAMSLMRMLRWLFAKSKISSKQVALDSLKLTLTLFLSTMDYVDGDDTGQVPRSFYHSRCSIYC